jgi:hypothetical protein
MKKLSQDLEDKLLHYLDGKLHPDEQKSVERLLGENELLRQRLEELKLADIGLRQLKVEVPSKNFTTTVMTRMDQYPARTGLSIRNGLLLLGGMLIVMVIAVVLLNSGFFNDQTSIDLNNLTVTQKYIKKNLPSISLDGELIVNAIILLNLALALVVLDRAVLRPFFQRRMQTGH